MSAGWWQTGAWAQLVFSSPSGCAALRCTPSLCRPTPHTPAGCARLRRGANVRAADAARGRTPLHWSAASDAAGAARLLLAAAADVASAVDRRGLTPFDLAVESGADDVAELMRAVADMAGP